MNRGAADIRQVGASQLLANHSTAEIVTPSRRSFWDESPPAYGLDNDESELIIHSMIVVAH